MIDAYKDISTESLDCLREAGNIAAANAVTALSQVINARVHMEVVNVKVRDIGELETVFGDPESYVAVNLIEIIQDVRGLLLLVFDIDSVVQVINQVMGITVEDVFSIGEMERSLLSEVGNILAGSYLNALTTLTSLDINQTPPRTAFDMAGAVLSLPAIAYSEDYENLVLVETSVRGNEDLIKGRYVFVVDDSSLRRIIGAMESLL
ncbi:MAG: hypothetical protein ATN36_06370 [Epulopiscium sp. Nele67-Bin005]|nr:MAG: hypothetical protein ATN36_06370 [Epulopiscium sp. Nele67-Bin005]